MEPTSVMAGVEGETALPMFPPEVAAAIRQLNVDPSNARFMKLVDDLLRPESLPRGWTSGFDEAAGVWWYKDKAGVLHDKHPVYDYYIGAMFMDKGGYAQLKRIAAERPPSAPEVEAMGLYLKIKKDEDVYIWQVAEMALCAPLPPGWEEGVTEVDGNPVVVFKYVESGVEQQEHPLDNYFRELIRRRRRELLRRKKAALKTLQALVKMGMGARRNQLAALAAKAKSETTEAPTVEQPVTGKDDTEPDIETMDPAAQQQLLASWQSLLGTAVHLVHSLQAAHWDGGTTAGSSSGNSSLLPTSPIAANAGSTGCAAAAAVQQRLSHIDEALSSALDINHQQPDAAATTALEEIEALSIQIQAAGSDTDALTRVLAGQGIVLPDYDSCAGSASLRSSRTGFERASGTGFGRPSGCGVVLEEQGNIRHPSMGGAESPLSPTSPKRRPSVCGSPEGSLSAHAPRTRRHSLLQTRQVDFVAADAGTGTAPGPAGVSTISPNAATAVPARVSIMWPGIDNGSSAGASISFVGCSMGGSADGSNPGNDWWSMSGSKPTAAGVAAAASVRTLAALRRESNVDEEGSKSTAAAISTAINNTEGSTVQNAAAGAAASTNAATVGIMPGQQVAEQNSGAAISQAVAAVTGDRHPTPGQVSPAQLTVVATTVAAPPADATAAGPALFAPCTDVPISTAALQHMSALQGILSEAVSLIRSWQQQKAMILLLQQRLKEAAMQTHDGQKRLAAALHQLAYVREEQAHHSDAAAAASVQYQQLLQQFQDVQMQLDATQVEKQQLQQGNEQLQASLESALAAAAAAASSQQQLEQQLQQVQQQLAQDQAAKAAQQSLLEQTTAELERLRAEHAQLQGDGTHDDSNAAAALSVEFAALQASHRELQTEHAKLQETLSEAQAVASTAQQQQEGLQQQLQQTVQQLQGLQDAFAVLQLQHQQQSQQLADSQTALAHLEAVHKQQQDQLLVEQQQQLQLQLEHKQLLDKMTGEQKDALQQHNELVQQCQRQEEQVRQLQQQLQTAEQCQQKLQEDYKQQVQQLQAEKHAGTQEFETLQQHLQDQNKQEQEQITGLQQQLQQLQQEKRQVQEQYQQIQADKEHLLEQQISFLNKQTEAQARVKAVQKELADIQAATKAAEAQRLANPRRSTQVSAADAVEQHWVHCKSVQTGEELDPRNKKDAGTPADLALISYFFRDIKQKQRGGGGAVIGYDPANARAAGATAVPPGSAKSWNGKPMLPSLSQPGGRESPLLKKRPATVSGATSPSNRQSLLASPRGKRPPETEEEADRFDLRPAPFEVKTRVDRRRDRAMRLETETGKGAADHDRWDYTLDERDNEIAELKKRLIEEQRKAKEAATKAADELQSAMEQFQASKQSVDQLQADNFTLRKELDTLKLQMQAVEMSRSYEASAAAAASSASGALRPSVFGGGISASKALGGRSSTIGNSSGDGGSRASSMWGSGFGGSVLVRGDRSSIAMLSPTGAASMPAYVSSAAGSGAGGMGRPSSAVNARASMFTAAPRSSVMAGQSPYAAAAALAKVAPRMTIAKKSVVLPAAASSESGTDT